MDSSQHWTKFVLLLFTFLVSYILSCYYWEMGRIKNLLM